MSRINIDHWKTIVEEVKDPKKLSKLTHTSMRHVHLMLRRLGFGELASRHAFIKRTGTKICSTCKKTKILSDFYKSKKTSDGKSNSCKQCNKGWHKNYRNTLLGLVARRRAANKYNRSPKAREKYRALKEKYGIMPKHKFTESIGRARRVGKVWSIEREDYFVLISKKCEYCGGDLPKYGTGLDRINNSIGYTSDNVVPCCWLCNKTRQDNFTSDEMKFVIGPAIRQILASRKAGGASLQV
jgi:hypothetical protein